MSLKAFHIFFIFVSTLLAFFFGTWLLFAVEVMSGTIRVVGGIAAFMIGFLLVMYGRYFLRKYRHLSFI